MLHQPSQCEIDDEGEPQRMITPDREQGEVESEEHHRGNCRGDEHAACLQQTDEDAIVDECRHAGHRNQQCPRQILHRSIHHTRLIGEQAEETATAQRIDRREQHHHQPSPTEQMPDDGLQRLGRSASVIFSTQGLSCIGKSVHHVGEECEECHQQSVHRQQHVALPCTRRRKEQVYRHQANRPKKQIEIGMEEGGRRKRPTPQPLPWLPKEEPPPAPPKEGRAFRLKACLMKNCNPRGPPLLWRGRGRFSHAITAPLHCAMSVPRATPSICILKPNTSTSEATILMMFCVIDTTIGVRVSCIPINQPVIT